MSQLLRVKGWNEHFESAKSRTYNNKSACQMPTKHGLGYHRLLEHEDGPALFGAWCAMIQVLSRQDKPREGYLTDTGRISGRPYTDSDMAILTNMPERLFDTLFKVCLSEPVGWLEVVTPRIPCGYHADTMRIPQGQLYSTTDSTTNSTSDLGGTRAREGADDSPAKRADGLHPPSGAPKGKPAPMGKWRHLTWQDWLLLLRNRTAGLDVSRKLIVEELTPILNTANWPEVYRHGEGRWLGWQLDDLVKRRTAGMPKDPRGDMASIPRIEDFEG